MPLTTGYSKSTVSSNIGDMLREGYSREASVAAAYAEARFHFFSMYPHRLLPSWLAFPKERRMRTDYDKHGTPLRHVKTNPAPRKSAAVRQAARRFQSFTGHRAESVKSIRVPGYPKAVLAIGPVLGIMYRTVRDGRSENYVHRFGKKSRPLLAASSDGTQLLMLGGAYNFTTRGIVDQK